MTDETRELGVSNPNGVRPVCLLTNPGRTPGQARADEPAFSIADERKDFGCAPYYFSRLRLLILSAINRIAIMARRYVIARLSYIERGYPRLEVYLSPIAPLIGLICVCTSTPSNSFGEVAIQKLYAHLQNEI